MKTKKIMSILLAMLLVLSCGIQAFAVESRTQNGTYVQPRFNNILLLMVSMTQKGTGVEAVARGMVSNDCTGEIIIYVQQSSDGISWKTIASDRINIGGGENGSLTLPVYNLKSNCSYRAKAYIYAYTTNGGTEYTYDFSNIITK